MSVTQEVAPNAQVAANVAAPPRAPLVVLIGNPNVGKTTLFNRLTGQNARVGNYPGITVERRSALVEIAGESNAEPLSVEVVDAPGTYSLSARSAEEQIALNAVLGLGKNPHPDLIVAVVDASQLIRNLYLVLELAELRLPLLVALNMIDEVADNRPHTAAISELFGVPCVATDARHGSGVAELERTIRSALADTPIAAVEIGYPQALRRDIDRVAEALPRQWRSSVERDRALSLWALSSVEPDDELSDIDGELRVRCTDVRARASDRDIEHEIIATRYAFLDAHAAELHQKLDAHPPKRAFSERLDRVLLHPVLGFLVFVLVMLLVFQSLFSWADPLISLIETAFAGLGALIVQLAPDGVLRDLVVEGAIGGVGNVVVFLPQILLLFLFIGVLEDSGYMARVAFLMDRIMRALGLHGRAFVPMLSGFACAVPAILATRTMERRRDRLLTMMVIPLMTCSARLPVYTLIIAALFPPAAVFGWLPVQGLLMIAMYVFSIVITLTAAAVLGRTVIRGRSVPLILELPPYRVPNARSILRTMWERSLVFLREAGSLILLFTIVLWALLTFPRSDALTAHATPAQAVESPLPGPGPGQAQSTESAAAARSRQIEASYAGRLGKALEPALEPLGFDWKIGVGILGAFAAREVFVSTMGLVYGVGEVKAPAEPLRDKIRAERRPNGEPVYTPLVGLSLMVFFALACQCMSTLAVVRRETRSWRWPGFMFAYMTFVAYLASLMVFQAGRALGF